MRPNRFQEIDWLRAVGILIIILIHATAYYKDNPVARNLWNFSQFAVQTFVFCSAYIFWHKEAQSGDFRFLPYFTKRLKRLVLPYYWYLLGFIPLMYLSKPKQVGLNYILQQLTLTTANLDLNWFVLLFLYFALLLPFIAYLYQQKRQLFYLFGLFSLAGSLFFMTHHLALNYKLTMWLPWSLIIIFALYFVKWEKTKIFAISGFFIACFLFLLARFWLQINGHSLVFFDNKYPPNFYFLVYGIFVTIILFYLARLGIFKMFFFQRSVHFLSTNSYSLFFIHFLLIFASGNFFNLKIFTWWQFFALILISTIVVQLTLSRLKNHLFSTL